MPVRGAWLARAMAGRLTRVPPQRPSQAKTEIPPGPGQAGGHVDTHGASWSRVAGDWPPLWLSLGWAALAPRRAL